ncbi:hypothetical protein GTZ89_47125 [Streptomyces sp. SID8382]|nr:hypothetical protein [Streptomyces sp. SID8382]
MSWRRGFAPRVRECPGARVRLRRAAPLPAPSHNWGSAPDPAPQAPEGLGGGPWPRTPLLKRRRGWVVGLGSGPRSSSA